MTIAQEIANRFHNDGQIFTVDGIDIDEVAEEAIVQELYPLFDLFVNDAFGAAHRSQASIVGFTKFLPSVAGRVMEKEIRELSKVIAKELHPWNLHRVLCF